MPRPKCCRELARAVPASVLAEPGPCPSRHTPCLAGVYCYMVYWSYSGNRFMPTRGVVRRLARCIECARLGYLADVGVVALALDPEARRDYTVDYTTANPMLTEVWEISEEGAAEAVRLLTKKAHAHG